MSYNIDHIHYQVIDAWMRPADIIRLNDQFEAELPEGCFLADHYSDAVAMISTKIGCKCNCVNDQDAVFCKKCGGELDKNDIKQQKVKLESLEWCGEGSNHSYVNIFLKHIVPFIKGTAELILTWESGDSMGALLIKDGKFIEAEVERVIVRPKGW